MKLSRYSCCSLGETGRLAGCARCVKAFESIHPPAKGSARMVARSHERRAHSSVRLIGVIHRSFLLATRTDGFGHNPAFTPRRRQSIPGTERSLSAFGSFHPLKSGLYVRTDRRTREKSSVIKRCGDASRSGSFKCGMGDNL